MFGQLVSKQAVYTSPYLYTAEIATLPHCIAFSPYSIRVYVYMYRLYVSVSGSAVLPFGTALVAMPKP